MASRRKKKKKKKGTKRVFFFLPLAGLLGSVTAPFIGEIAKPIFKKIAGGRRRRQ